MGRKLGRLRYETQGRDAERFYFAAQEVMILPTFNKRVHYVARRRSFDEDADPETSYLLKHFAVGAPVLVVSKKLAGAGSRMRKCETAFSWAVCIRKMWRLR